jgi:ribosomal protein S18 acetylase RimI-like enzyme
MIRDVPPSPPVLRPITDAEFASWLAMVVPEYAQDKVDAGQWPADTALELSRETYRELLPHGKDSDGNHIFSILGDGGRVVGTLWFVVKSKADRPVAFIYDVHVAPEHRRRGYASAALRAVEHEVARLGLGGIALHVFGHNVAARALYAKLGYVETNVQMYKGLEP